MFLLHGMTWAVGYMGSWFNLVSCPALVPQVAAYCRSLTDSIIVVGNFTLFITYQISGLCLDPQSDRPQL